MLLLPWGILTLLGCISLFLPPDNRKIALFSILLGVWSLLALVGCFIVVVIVVNLVFEKNLGAVSLFYGLFMGMLFFNGWIVLIIASLIASSRFYKARRLKSE